MADKVIRLDNTKPFAECRGERTPDDPHYRVHFVQTYKMGKKSVQLFFDAAGILVPDDGKKEPWKGTVDGKPATFHPIYNDDQRAVIAKLKERAEDEPEEEDDDVVAAGEVDENAAGKAIDLKTWLRTGSAMRLKLSDIRSAMKAQFGKNPQSIKEVVIDLVLDERLIPEGELCAEFAKFLPRAAA